MQADLPRGKRYQKPKICQFNTLCFYPSLLGLLRPVAQSQAPDSGVPSALTPGYADEARGTRANAGRKEVQRSMRKSTRQSSHSWTLGRWPNTLGQQGIPDSDKAFESWRHGITESERMSRDCRAHNQNRRVRHETLNSCVSRKVAWRLIVLRADRQEGQRPPPR